MQGIAAFGHVNDDEFGVSGGQQFFRRVAQAFAAQCAVFAAQRNPDGLPGLDFIQNQIIHIFQRRNDEAGEPIRHFADDIHRCFQAHLLKSRERARHNRAEFRIRRIHAVQQQNIADLGDLVSSKFFERNMRDIPFGIRPDIMEKCALTALFRGHGIRV